MSSCLLSVFGRSSIDFTLNNNNKHFNEITPSLTRKAAIQHFVSRVHRKIKFVNCV